MRTLKIFTAAAVTMLLASGAGATLTLDVLDSSDSSSGAGGVGMKIVITLSGVGGGGLGALGANIATDGVVTNAVGVAFSGVAFTNGNPDGSALQWDDGVAGPTNLAPTQIMTFDLAGASPGSIVDLTDRLGYNATQYYYLLDDFGFGYDIVINPYTVVPEPTTAALLGLGLFGLALGGRRR